MINEHMITIGVTLSLQTVNPKSLKAIARENISTQSYEDLQQRFSLDGTYTYTDVILSLPEEDYESFRDGVEVIIQNGQYNHIQFHNLSILPNAEMGNAAYQERYGMKVVPQRIVAIHDYIEDVSGEEVAEYLDVVVGTNTLLSNDWHKAKVFSWYMDFLFFDKISQVALLLLKRLLGIRIVDMVDAIMCADSETYPILHELNSLAFEHSRKIQDGGDEYIPSEEWMGVYWPVNQYLRLTLLDTAKLNRFYDELESLIRFELDRVGRSLDVELLDNIFLLNRSIPIQMGEAQAEAVSVRWNVYEMYSNAIGGKEVTPKEDAVNLLFRVSANAGFVLSDLEAYCQYIIGAHSAGKHKYLFDVTEEAALTTMC
ncbi:MAG TPA: hypothetical protein EYF94_04880 [Porticoccaceae bacterium]|nr:hypothetical protein [Porticoccaceae bacterium]